MAEIGEEKVFGGVEYDGSFQEQAGNIGGVEGTDGSIFQRVEADALPTKPSVWSKIRSFLFQEIDLMQPITVELTPYQQKVEDEINAFLHQEVSFKGFFNLFKKQK